MNVQEHQGNSSLPLSSLSGRSYRDEEVMCWILPGFLQRQMTRDGKIATQEELPHNHHLCFEGGLFFLKEPISTSSLLELSLIHI